VFKNLYLVAFLALASCAQTKSEPIDPNTHTTEQGTVMSDNQRAAATVGGAVGIYMLYVALGFSAFLASVTG